MASRLNPYISYNGNAREAFEFYQGVFGGELAMNTFGEFGASETPDADKIMHASLEAPNGFTLMGSDTPAEMEFKPGTTMSVSLSGDDGDDLRGYYEKLAGVGRRHRGVARAFVECRSAVGGGEIERPLDHVRAGRRCRRLRDQPRRTRSG
ncbi:VOC family protein [Kribbella qitaiheensis]|uniref:VOC family protein n=1 Tax=Kribbella qitaiheensis TaxID=1544730 RepID=A0A7G6WZJ1_9ACTN|nr:VOC family protein [Kribbella qitaiheensis]QNE19406.1 VOC family protein [Kribbella qitaiheensis]